MILKNLEIKRVRILYVNRYDSYHAISSIFETLSSFLKHKQYFVIFSIVNDLFSAAEHCRSSNVDVLFIDETFDENHIVNFRKTLKNQDIVIPIIKVLSEEDSRVKRRVLPKSNFLILKKPFKIKELLDVICRALPEIISPNILNRFDSQLPKDLIYDYPVYESNKRKRALTPLSDSDDMEYFIEVNEFDKEDFDFTDFNVY